MKCGDKLLGSSVKFSVGIFSDSWYCQGSQVPKCRVCRVSRTRNNGFWVDTLTLGTCIGYLDSFDAPNQSSTRPLRIGMALLVPVIHFMNGSLCVLLFSDTVTFQAVHWYTVCVTLSYTAKLIGLLAQSTTAKSFGSGWFRVCTILSFKKPG